MEYGYIGFSYTKDTWIAKQIAWFSKSKWSHSFITVPPMLGREMVMEAGSGGVSMMPFDIDFRTNKSQAYEVYRFKCDKDNIDKAINECMNILEKGYGYKEYFWYIWRNINARFGRDIKSQDNWDERGIVCSGLVRKYLTECGYGHFFSGFGINSEWPQDIYEIVQAHPELFELVEKKD